MAIITTATSPDLEKTTTLKIDPAAARTEQAGEQDQKSEIVELVAKWNDKLKAAGSTDHFTVEKTETQDRGEKKLSDVIYLNHLVKKGTGIDRDMNADEWQKRAVEFGPKAMLLGNSVPYDDGKQLMVTMDGGVYTTGRNSFFDDKSHQSYNSPENDKAAQNNVKPDATPAVSVKAPKGRSI